MCWQQIVARTDVWRRLQIGQAARCASEYWTVDELNVARVEIAGLCRAERVPLLVDLLWVATRLGADDLVRDAFAAIDRQEDPNDALSYTIQAIKSLSPQDAYCGLFADTGSLRRCPGSRGSVRLLMPLNFWTQMIKRLHGRSSRPAQSSLCQSAFHLRACPRSPRVRRRELLLEGALLACIGDITDQRIPAAAQIALKCKTQAEVTRF